MIIKWFLSFAAGCWSASLLFGEMDAHDGEGSLPSCNSAILDPSSSLASIKGDLKDAIPEMRAGVLPHFARSYFVDIQTVGSATIVLSGLISDFQLDEQALIVESVISACDDKTRPACAYYFSAKLMRGAFAREFVQKWLVSNMSRDMFIPWAFPLLSFDNQKKVRSIVCDDARRFSEEGACSTANLAHLLSVAYAASLGDAWAVHVLEDMMESVSFNSSLKSRYLLFATALSCNRSLLNRLCLMAATDTSVHWNGSDSVPSESSLACTAAHACAIVIRGFPQSSRMMYGMNAKDYDREMRSDVQKWVADNGAKSYNLCREVRRIFKETPFVVLTAPILKRLMDKGVSEGKEESEEERSRRKAEVKTRLEGKLRELESTCGVWTNAMEMPLVCEADNRSIADFDSSTKGEANDAIACAIRMADPSALKGAIAYENEETRAEGVALLRKSAKAGNAFALARLSALYYLGEGGVNQDYEMSLKLMKRAVDKGFPVALLPISEAQERLDLQQQESVRRKSSNMNLMPGFGFKGVLAPYSVSPYLGGFLEKYRLTAGWFVRDDSAIEFIDKNERHALAENKLPYLLFRPKTKLKSVPMLIYVGGLGERGVDLSDQFHQTAIFDMITSMDFQEKFPCYLFAPMVPKDADLRCQRGFHSPDADLVCDAMYAIIHEVTMPKIDTNRLYLTGLSVGGSAAYTFPFGYPGRFAASIPVAGYATRHSVPEKNPGRIWLFCNDNECASDQMKKVLADMAETIKDGGGEFRVSTFPDKGHNAWDKAWRENVVWEWLFSKTADGKMTLKTRNATRATKVAANISDSKCYASIQGKDATTIPEMAIDGLEATCYVSASPLKIGDFWAICFCRPFKGSIEIKSGYKGGVAIAKSAHVETSSTGRTWYRHGGFSPESGECRLVLNSPVRYLRVVSDSKTGEVLVLREVSAFK